MFEYMNKCEKSQYKSNTSKVAKNMSDHHTHKLYST